MLRIGYVRLSEAGAEDDAVQVLRALGCHVVRAEEDNDVPTVLASILEFIAEPALTSAGPEGETLRAALAAVAALEPVEPPRRRTRAPTHEIRALQRAGMGPVEIARRLGVSRMTVWRKLKALSADPCTC
jgi:DNA-binding NtrC family response regulator